MGIEARSIHGLGFGAYEVALVAGHANPSIRIRGVPGSYVEAYRSIAGPAAEPGAVSPRWQRGGSRDMPAQIDGCVMGARNRNASG